MAVITNPHNRALSWISTYIADNPYADLEYKTIMNVLKKEKQFYIRCYLLDNKYLYGSIIAEAKVEAMTC